MDSDECLGGPILRGDEAGIMKSEHDRCLTGGHEAALSKTSADEVQTSAAVTLSRLDRRPDRESVTITLFLWPIDAKIAPSISLG